MTAVTIDKLRTFIEAVEFASDSDSWIPSPKQWAKIREMIDNLVSDPPPPPMMYAPHVQAAPAWNAPPAPVPQQEMAAFNAPSSLAGSYGQRPGGSGLLGNGPSVKTPDIDTSSGRPYTPAFV